MTTENTDRNAEGTNAHNAQDATATTGADVTANTTQDDDEEDPIEVAIQARLAIEADKRAEAIAAKLVAQREAQLAESNRARDSEAEQVKLRESFADAIKSSRNGLKQLEIYDANGKRVEFTDTAFEDLIVKPFQKHNSEAERAHQSVVVNALTQAAIDSLPTDERADFTTKAGGKPINEWLKTFAEMYAPHAAAVSDLKREEDARIAAAEARGFAKGQKSKGGSAPQGTDRPNNTDTFDLNTQIGLIRANMAGKLSDAEYTDRRRKLERGF